MRVQAQAKFLLHLTKGAFHHGVSPDMVLFSNVSPGPNDDLFVQGIRAGSFLSTQAKNVTALVANDHHRQGLSSLFVRLHFFARCKASRLVVCLNQQLGFRGLNAFLPVEKSGNFVLRN